jgi:uncharacterized integral membrane protein
MESLEQPQAPMERRQAGRGYGRLIVPAVVAVFVLILILQNRTEHWRFHFFFWWLSLRAWLMVVLLLALGFLIGMAISAYLRRRRRVQLKSRGTVA